MTKKFVVRAGNKFVKDAFEMFVDCKCDVDIVLNTLSKYNKTLEPDFCFKGYVAEVISFIPDNGDKEIVQENFVKRF